MAGGNSHQRAVEKASKVRINKKVAEAPGKIRGEPMMSGPDMKKVESHRKLKRFGFAGLCFLTGFLLFAAQMFYSMIGSPPSWIGASAWLSVTVLLITIGIWFWDRSATSHWFIRTVVTLVVSVLAVAIGYAPIHKQFSAEHPAQPTTSPTAIFLESEMVELPLSVPAGATLHIVPINKRQMKASSWGFYEFSNGGPSELRWPDKHVINRARTTPKLSVWAWKCQLSNHGTANVLDVSICLKISMDNQKPELTHTIIVSPLDNGSKFTFYVVNDCQYLTSAMWPDTVTLQVLGESQRHTVPLRMMHKTPIDQIMLLFGSAVSLSGNPCE